jgi:SAM-dependent methyltransferase
MPVDFDPHRGAGESLSALLYQAHHRHYLADLPFWIDLAEDQEGDILELGCGTGRVLIPIAEAGHNVFGLDRDPEMLKFCRLQIPAEIAPRVHLLQADISSFQLKIQFPLIILPCNTFSTLEQDTRRSALKCIRQALSPGGIFAASMPNPVVLLQLEPTDQAEMETSFPHPRTGNPVQASYELERSQGEVTLVWHYDHLLPDGHVERFSVTTSHQQVTLAEYLHEFQQSGFGIQATYGGFDYEPHLPTSSELIIVARKV